MYFLQAESKLLQSQKMAKIQLELESILDAPTFSYDALSQANLARETFLFVAPNFIRFHAKAKQQG
jgi:hypothetical protein